MNIILLIGGAALYRSSIPRRTFQRRGDAETRGAVLSSAELSSAETFSA